MPIYEYSCNECGVIEVIQRITDEPLEQCPKCKNNNNFKKVISQSAFHLKGSGWYKSDYCGTDSKKKPEPPKSGGGGCGPACGCC